jgi:hypothetical protein
VGDDPFEIGAPASEIVVDVDRWNARVFCSFLESGDLLTCGERAADLSGAEP